MFKGVSFSDLHIYVYAHSSNTSSLSSNKGNNLLKTWTSMYMYHYAIFM